MSFGLGTGEAEGPQRSDDAFFYDTNSRGMETTAMDRAGMISQRRTEAALVSFS